MKTVIFDLDDTLLCGDSEFKWAEFNRIDMLYGHSQLRVFAAQGKPANYLPPLWLKDVIKFNEFRQRFLIY